MRVSAKTDYALRAAVELAAAAGNGTVKGERLATSQSIPLRFLENILLHDDWRCPVEASGLVKGFD